MIGSEGKKGPAGKMAPKVLLAILAHHDPARLERGVKTAIAGSGPEQLVVVSHSRDPGFGDAARQIAETHGVGHQDFPSATASAPTGKQKCLDLFLESDADFMVQLDGDDFLYRQWRSVLDDYLRRVPCMDALCIWALDTLSAEKGHGFSWSIMADLWGSIWTTGGPWEGLRREPGWSDAFGDSPGSVPAMVRLYSRKAAEVLRFRGPEEGYPEDQLLLLDLITAHLRGDLLAVNTTRSDLYVIDRMTPDADQKVRSASELRAGWAKMRQTAATICRPDRSHIGEAPWLYAIDGAGMVETGDKIAQITAGALMIPHIFVEMESEEGHAHS